MKFHNQKSFMGHEISNVTNKPLLHKKGKQWIVVAVSALILAGFGGVASTTTHADTTSNGAQTESAASTSANSNSTSSASSTQNQAKALHLNLLQNATVQKPNKLTTTNSSNNSNNNSSTNPAVHMMLTEAPVSVTKTGNWGSAKWTLYNNGRLNIHDGTLSDSLPSYFSTTDGSNKLEPDQGSNGSKMTWGDHVKSITTSNLTAPTNHSLASMFCGDTAGGHFNFVSDIDLSGLDTSGVTNMSNMFHGCWHLKTVNFGPTFDTSNVTTMNSMFDDDSSIQYLDLSSFDTYKVSDYGNMFWNTPSLKILDLSNFQIKPGANVNAMLSITPQSYNVGTDPSNSEPTHLRELVLSPSFKNLHTGTLWLNNSGIGNNPSSSKLYNPNTQEQVKNWSDVLGTRDSNPGTWIDGDSIQSYTVEFINELSNKPIGNGTENDSQPFKGIGGVSFLPIKGINLPSGFQFSKNEGDTAQIIPGTTTAQIKLTPKLPSNTVDGIWGSAIWTFDTHKDILTLEDGGLENKQVPSESTNNLSQYINSVKKINTNNVLAPADSSNLFKDFNNVTDINLEGMDFSHTTNIQDMLPNTDASVELNSSYYNLLGNIAENTSASANTNSKWISSNSASLSSASTSANNADSWVYSNSNSAQSAASWVSSNSSSESNASAKADANSTSISALINGLNVGKGNSKTIQNAINSAAQSVASKTSVNGSFATQSNFNHLFSNSGSNTISSIASNVALSLATSLSSIYETQASASSKANSNDVTNEISSLTKSNGTIDSLANSIATSYASNAVNWVNSNGSTVSNEAKSASTSASTNAKNIGTNTSNINTNSNTAASGISNDNTSASASASVANANADSYAQSLANNATNTANNDAGGINVSVNGNDQAIQSLSNTVNTDNNNLSGNIDDLYSNKQDKPVKVTKKHNKNSRVNHSLFYFYVIKPLWLHTNAKFTKNNRVKALTAKHGYTLPIARIFKVNGALRFEVKVNNKNYFVTGRKDFVQNAYVQPNEVHKNSFVKVMKAVREYKRAGFGKKNFIRNFRRGSVLPIKRAKTIANKQVTRLQLNNGHWITANRNFVKLI